MIRVDAVRCVLNAFGRDYRCAIGRGGALAEDAKREGDGATPLGRWGILGALLRPDRMAAPLTALPWRWLRPQDGWGDDPHDPCYNRPVVHPHGFSAERLWREDAAYDIIITLQHNVAPVVAGRGSAIFWHVAHSDFRPTEGCVAMERAALSEILDRLQPGMAIEIGQGFS